MEDIEFCKADFLYMLSELNEYAVMNDVKDVSINNLTYVDCFEFIHHDVRYEREIKLLNISLGHDTHDTAYEKYERMMKCMKEGVLLVD